MVLKKIQYDVRLLSTEKMLQGKVPVVYTNDLNSAEFVFDILDMTSEQLAGATATTLLYMRDGSFFQNSDVNLDGTTFTYLLKENEGNHSGLAKIQLVVKIGTAEYASQLYSFEVVNGLETKVSTEVMIRDWTTLLSEARAYIAQFLLDEEGRQATFVANEQDRQLAFEAVEALRQQKETERQEAEAVRQQQFDDAQTERTNIFTQSETDRATAFEAAETLRQQKETERLEAESKRIEDEALRQTGYDADHGRAETDHATAVEDHAIVQGFNARLTAEETATANSRISTVKGTTFADVDARFEDVEADTTLMGTNIITNGDFSNGTAGWSWNRATLTIANNEATVTPTVLGSSVALHRPSLSRAGNKIYVSGEIYPKYATLTRFGFSTGETISFNPNPNTWTRKSSVLNSNGGLIIFNHSFDSGGYVITDTIRFRRLLTIDLTATFGAGNEPTAEQMDAIMAKFPNSWFDGTRNLFSASETLKRQITLHNEKANKVQEEWITPTLLNGWVNFGTGYPSCQYIKDELGFVHLKGMIKNGTLNSDCMILPVGYRPLTAQYHVGISADVARVINITSGGGVRIPQSANNSWVTLNGIKFRAEA